MDFSHNILITGYGIFWFPNGVWEPEDAITEAVKFLGLFSY
jgi:hypothetical protein